MKHHHQLRHQKKSKGNNKKQALKFCSRYSVFFFFVKMILSLDLPFLHLPFYFVYSVRVFEIAYYEIASQFIYHVMHQMKPHCHMKKKKQQPRIEEKKICIHQRNEKMGKYWNVRSNVCTHMREMFYAKQCTLNYSFDIFFFGLHRRKIE